MKKVVSVILAVLMLAVGTAAFADNAEAKKETVKAYYDFGVTVTFPEEYRDLIGNVYVDNYGMLNENPEIRLLEYSYSSLPKEEFKTGVTKIMSGTATEEESEEFWKDWGSLALVVSVKNGSFDDAGMILSLLSLRESIDRENVTELATVEDTHYYIYIGGEEEYVKSLDEEHAGDYAAAKELILKAYQAAEYYPPADPMKAIVGTTLSFETADLEGNAVKSEDLFAENEITMVNIWATWCGPCTGELEELGNIHRRLQEKNCGIVGIVTDDDVADAAAKSLISEKNVSYPNLCVSEDMDVLDYVDAIPTTLFVDKNGVILCEPIIGAAVTEYEKTVDELLAAQGS